MGWFMTCVTPVQIVTSFLLQWRLHTLKRQIVCPVVLAAYLSDLKTGPRLLAGTLLFYRRAIVHFNHLLPGHNRHTVSHRIAEKHFTACEIQMFCDGATYGYSIIHCYFTTEAYYRRQSYLQQVLQTC